MQKRLGFPIFFAVLIGGVIASFFGAFAYLLITGESFDPDVPGGPEVAGGYAQFGAWIVLAVAFSYALGSGPARDYGLGLRIKDLPWLAAGAGIQVVAVVLILPIQRLLDFQDQQQVVSDLADISGGAKLLFAVLVVVITPVAEEILFRGILLRRLLQIQTKLAAIILSAFIFASVHFLFDFGAALATIPIFAVGFLSAQRAVKTESLSQAILIHAGFNGIAGIALLFA